MSDPATSRSMGRRDFWLIGSIAVFILAVPICGWLIWQGVFGHFIGFGGLLAGPLLAAGVNGTLIAGAAGMLLALVSFYRKGRHRLALIVVVMNLLLAGVPYATVLLLSYGNNQAREAALAALGPSERLLWLASTSGMIHRQQELVGLLERGGDVNAVSVQSGLPVLTYAIIHQDEAEVVDVLVGHGADVNLPTREGWAPLHVAASAGKAEMVVRLLRHGADRTMRTPEGERAMDIAKQRLNVQREAYLRQPFETIIALLQDTATE